VLTLAPEPEHNGGYDADFFADNDGGFGDVYDGEAFADAREQFSPGVADHPSAPDVSQSEEFGSLLRARRARPDYVNYAKTAKKVDVRRLKENLWTKLDLEVPHRSPKPVVLFVWQILIVDQGNCETETVYRGYSGIGFSVSAASTCRYQHEFLFYLSVTSGE